MPSCQYKDSHFKNRTVYDISLWQWLYVETRSLNWNGPWIRRHGCLPWGRYRPIGIRTLLSVWVQLKPQGSLAIWITSPDKSLKRLFILLNCYIKRWTSFCHWNGYQSLYGICVFYWCRKILRNKNISYLASTLNLPYLKKCKIIVRRAQDSTLKHNFINGWNPRVSHCYIRNDGNRHYGLKSAAGSWHSSRIHPPNTLKYTANWVAYICNEHDDNVQPSSNLVYLDNMSGYQRVHDQLGSSSSQFYHSIFAIRTAVIINTTRFIWWYALIMTMFSF